MSKHGEGKKSTTTEVFSALMAVSIVGAALRGEPISTTQETVDLDFKGSPVAVPESFFLNEGPNKSEKPNHKVRDPKHRGWEYANNNHHSQKPKSHGHNWR